MSNMSTKDWMDIEDDLREQLASRDAEVARLEGELRDAKDDAAEGRRLLWQQTESERAYVKGITNADATIAELRAEVERWKDATDNEWKNHVERAEKAEIEVERLRVLAGDIHADTSGMLAAALSDCDALQADLTEALAVVREAIKYIRNGQWPSVYHTWQWRTEIVGRGVAVLAKSEGGT